MEVEVATADELRGVVTERFISAALGESDYPSGTVFFAMTDEAPEHRAEASIALLEGRTVAFVCDGHERLISRSTALRFRLLEGLLRVLGRDLIRVDVRDRVFADPALARERPSRSLHRDDPFEAVRSESQPALA